MLLAITGQTRSGRIGLHPSKTLLRMVNHRTCATLTWTISTWPTITLGWYTSIATRLSTTMSGLLWISPHRHSHRHRPPHPLYVLISFFRIHASNQMFCWMRLMTQLGTLRLILLVSSSVNGLPRALSSLCQRMKFSGSLRSYTCASPFHKLLRFAWSRATPMVSG